MNWKNERRLLSELKPAKYNPRRLTPKQKADLNESIQKYSLVDPLVINTTGTIIGGHQRYSLLVDRGDLEVDVRVPERELNEVVLFFAEKVNNKLIKFISCSTVKLTKFTQVQYGQKEFVYN